MIAEDHDPQVRAQGLEVLANFIRKCPGETLLTTGIDLVFQEAIFPTLLFLPSLTPERDSLRVLSPAYTALINLATAYGTSTQQAHKLCEKLLREGIFAGYHHASEHIHIVELLMQYSTTIIGCMGIYCVKHMQVRYVPLVPFIPHEY